MYTIHWLSVFFLIQLYRAQVIEAGNSSPNCQVDGITDHEWTTQKVFQDIINDTEANKVVFQGTYSNIKSVGSCGKYFCILLNEAEKSFKIVPSEKFSDIDGNGDYHRTDSTTVEVQSTIDVICTSGKRTLTFKITVRDTNNHPPVFSQKTYTYTLPMPMSPKTNITNFGDEITVEDIDFSNKNMKFSSNFEGLTYIVGEEGNYSYNLQLQFTGEKKLKSSEQFILTATDSGEPSKSSTATIIFNIDEENSEPPSFSKPSYLFDYDSKAIKIEARKGQDIMLESARNGLKCSIEEEEYSPFFDDVVVDKQNIKLSLKKPFDDDIIAESVAQVTLQCYISKDISISSADVVISFPQTSMDDVNFSKKKYIATYKIDGDNHDIVMEDIITVTGNTDDVDITVEKYWSEYFEVKPISAGWTLGKIKNLNESILKNIEIGIIIELSKKNGQKPIDDAFITLTLPNGEEGVYFTAPYFIGDYTYDDNGCGYMEPVAIRFNNNDLDITKCGLDDSEYSGYFRTSCEEADKIVLEKVNSLPEKLLKTGTVPLSMWVDIKLGNIQRNVTTAILLNLSYKETSSTTSTSISPSTSTTVSPQSAASDDCSNTAWIIAVIILFLLLVAYVTATMLYYFKRIRNRNEVDYVPQQRRLTPMSRTSDDKKFKNVSTRRPTGFIRYNPDQDRNSLDSESGEKQIELNNNTNANKYLKDPDETSRKDSSNSNSDRRSVGFIIPPPPAEPVTLSDELKRAVEERGNRLLQ